MSDRSPLRPLLGAAVPRVGLYLADAPWWGLLLATVPGCILLIAQAVALVLREVWPQESGHRLSLLQSIGRRRPAAPGRGQNPPVPSSSDASVTALPEHRSTDSEP